MLVVSIIVPVFNAEPYLCHCLDSILSQSFADLSAKLYEKSSGEYDFVLKRTKSSE